MEDDCFNNYLMKVSEKYNLDNSLFEYNVTDQNAKKFTLVPGKYKREFVLFLINDDALIDNSKNFDSGLSWTNRAGTMLLSLKKINGRYYSTDLEAQILHEYYVERDLGQYIQGQTIGQKNAMACLQVQWAMTQYRADQYANKKLSIFNRIPITSEASSESCSSIIIKYNFQKIALLADPSYLLYLKSERFKSGTYEQFLNSISRQENLSTTECDSRLFQLLDNSNMCEELKKPHLSNSENLPNSVGPRCAPCIGGE